MLKAKLSMLEILGKKMFSFCSNRMLYFSSQENDAVLILLIGLGTLVHELQMTNFLQFAVAVNVEKLLFLRNRGLDN
jgi:hypothetical protein